MPTLFAQTTWVVSPALAHLDALAIRSGAAFAQHRPRSILAPIPAVDLTPNAESKEAVPSASVRPIIHLEIPASNVNSFVFFLNVYSMVRLTYFGNVEIQVLLKNLR